MRFLLPVICYLLTDSAFAQTTKPRILKLTSNEKLFERLTGGLDAQQLLRTYRTNLKLLQVRRNRHEPAIEDSILQVNTPADKLTLFKNRYNALLYGASITSNRVSFAGFHVGVAKADFCRALHLKPGYDKYVITDGMENFVQLRFTFIGDKLQRVDYEALINLDTID